MTADKRNLPAKRDQIRGSGKVTHGIYSFLRTGKVNPSVRGFKRIQRYLQEIERDLVNDLGGPENMTTAQEVLVKSTIQAYGVLLLAGAYTQRYSILRPDKAKRGILELQPVLGQQFIAFQNSVRQNLLALGLDRKKVEGPELADYLRETYPDKPRDQGPNEDQEPEAPREGKGEDGADE